MSIQSIQDLKKYFREQKGDKMLYNSMKIQFIESLLNQPKNKPFLIIDDRIISYKDFLILLSKTISFLSKTDKRIHIYQCRKK